MTYLSPTSETHTCVCAKVHSLLTLDLTRALPGYITATISIHQRKLPSYYSYCASAHPPPPPPPPPIHSSASYPVCKCTQIHHLPTGILPGYYCSDCQSIIDWRQRKSWGGDYLGLINVSRCTEPIYHLLGSN